MIEPLDIKSQQFKKAIFGYKASEVDSYVNTVYRAYDDLYKEHEALTKKFNGAETSLQECRLKIFELENQVNQIENVSTYDSEDSSAAKKKADDIIKNAESAAAEIIAKAKEQAKKFETGVASAKPVAEESKVEVKEEAKTTFSIKGQAPKAAPKPAAKPVEEEIKESASSRFFKKAEEAAPAAATVEDDDEIFVGEIEDARKPERMMIGDGEEEEDLDFEFL